MNYQLTKDFASELDKKDSLKEFRKKFLFPQHEQKDVIYLTGNSLGLQPVDAKKYILQELDDWQKFGVEGHFLAKNPWFSYHELLTADLAEIVGALPKEVIVMNQLTVNLHLLMVSFYKPTKTRYKILCEAQAFPSDLYALETQARYHGYDPDEAIIYIQPEPGEKTVRPLQVIDLIRKHKDELAMVMIGGVNYLTGQVFDMKAITEEAHSHGIIAGFDLAHAAGNIELKLHEWNVDFAAWCSYKYMNSGPGGVAGAFIHEKHVGNKDLGRFAGWWGHDKATRFNMEKGFIPMPTAEGWQLSNAPVLSMAVHRSSLDIFKEAGFQNLVSKSKQLTGYMDFMIREINKMNDNHLQIITPDIDRGCQLSIITKSSGKTLYQYLLKNGVIVDWREPDVIRMAPVPLYNSFMDVYNLSEILKSYYKN